MDQNTLLFVYAALFVGILLLVEGLTRLFGRNALEERVNLRMRMRNSGADPEEIFRTLRRTNEREGWERFPIVNGLPDLVIQAGVRIKPLRILLLMIGGFLFFTILLSVAYNPLIAALLGFMGAIVVPVLILLIKRSRRQKALQAQIPDMLDLIVRSVRAGHPINAAMAVVAQEMPDPMGTEAGIVVDQVTYGDAMPVAIAEMADRIGVEDISYFAVAIRIQSGTGGNLAEILSALSKVVRDRFAMVRKIRAVSAEGRISAYVLSFMPFGTAALLNLVAPAYLGAVADDPLFMPMVFLVCALALTNAAVLYKMTHFRI